MTHAEKLRATQEFFGPKAAAWEKRFPDDGPQYTRAVSELKPAPGATALDLGCGTGRALLPLRAAVGPTGQVIGLDATREMLGEARRLDRDRVAQLILGDVLRLPFPAEWADVVFAGGLLPHLGDAAEAALKEMARVTRPGGKLAIFHPISRKTLAARHNRIPSDDDIIAPQQLPRLCAVAGWEMIELDDADDRYLALAVRR